MYVYAQGYERHAASPEPVVAYVSLYRGAAKAFETAPQMVTPVFETKAKSVPMGFTLSLSGLPPGEYTCQLTVMNTATQKATFWRAPVRLVP
jgi:hypothetical protein